MHSSGRFTGGKLGLAFALLTAVGTAIAMEAQAAPVPVGDAYVVNAVLVPGSGGADVVGDDMGQGHVDFRVGFGADRRLCVNGVDAGVFDPSAEYRVTIECTKSGLEWFATTHVVDQASGAVVFEQANYPMPAGANEVHAHADDLIQLSVN